ncbi:CPBP family intramembrane glutamic endopeptidase [Moraxella bovis]|uniref:CPBP family intramembrane metalloprotease n=1 Tax=Moraxella bovis TaxID=476 RepID=A0AAQ2Q4V2_MORBO|nr:CPBP family intramembrane glutamic endopeptidase [Moraxella bovis]UYZ74875.1 CPBP family intramembrane metalloprotease [Moraxella bovis]UYZ79197.1 CPBP family intramembrane metalloprotease [Moraxella bovis]UYZ87677.1 CPBP family intramembrane metalloprotease [Moraxella bovis]UYZ93098.1 CPBP family intramembrane metalloprotease [Moraxella bovis]UYZ96980.1 CPBP family intramembrane metalloprotease [Moraxella bovis]
MLHHDLTAPQMSKPSPRPAISFSAVGVVGLCLFCLFGMFALQIIGVYIGSLAYYEQAGSLNVATLIMLGSNNGVVVAISVFITALAFTLFAVGLVLFKSKTARHGTPHQPPSAHHWGEFFGIKAISVRGFVVSLIGMIAFMAVSEIILTALDSSPMDFLDGLITDESLPLLIFAIVVVAPIYEELVFRGLIFGGLLHRHRAEQIPIRLVGFTIAKSTLMASLISSLLFTLVHLQYDLLGMMVIFAMALLFCYIRVKYGLIMAILMHMVNNGMAMAVYLAS